MIEDQVPQILASLPDRISDIVAPWANRSPNHPALVENSGTWTYQELASAIAETQTWLVESGVRPGDRVLIVCENCRAYIAILLALAALDAWPVLASARLSAREIDLIRDHCGARLVLYTTSVSHFAREHAKRHGAVVETVKNLGPIGVGSLNQEVQPETIDSNPLNRVAVLIYTSGTTGLPKGVMLTHRNLLYLAAVSAKIRSLVPKDRMYGVLPMSHAVGLSVVLLGTLISGATLYLSPRFDPVAALSALEKDGITVLLGVPAMFALLVEYANTKGLGALKFPSLRIISSSGAPLHAALKASVEKLFAGMVLYNGYGVTECSPTIAQAIVEDPRPDVSVGRAFPGSEIALIGADGNPVTDGEVGELRVRGPHVMKGYYRAPDETAAVIDADGWFNTRDLARLDGVNLFIVGRTKELIVRFGFNVYPAEVEAVLNTYQGVARSAVIGRNIEGAEGGEDVVAFVEPLPGATLTPDELAEHAAIHLATYKRPTLIQIVPNMPVTPTGKVMKDALAKMVESGTPSA
ncbi:MAG: AMP-binding protein [Candidatus Acidiferrales bacterium]